MQKIFSYTLTASFLLPSMACSDSTSTRTGLGPVQTAAYEKLEEFEDYLPVFSSDGQRAVFLSKRTSDVPLVYFYDAAANVKLVRFDDLLGLDPADAKESLASINSSGTLVALSRTKLATGASQLIVSQASGVLKATLDLPAGASLNELHFARGSVAFLAYVERAGKTKTVKVLKVTLDSTALSLTEIGSFPDQSDVSFTLLDSRPTLISFGAADTNLEQAMTIRYYDESQAVWVTGANGFKSKVSSLSRSIAMTDAGFFSIARLSAPKIRNRLGTGPTVGQDVISEKVSISDSLSQMDIFSKALKYDFAAENYLSTEPLGVSAISGTADGQFLLTSGIDAFSCAQSSQQFPIVKVIRRSDMKAVTFLLARKIGTQVWTDIVTEPCSIFEDGSSREYDTTVQQADLIGQDGEFFLVAIHSFARGDEEIRLAKFKVDFDLGVASEFSIGDVSSNSR